MRKIVGFVLWPEEEGLSDDFPSNNFSARLKNAQMVSMFRHLITYGVLKVPAKRNFGKNETVTPWAKIWCLNRRKNVGSDDFTPNNFSARPKNALKGIGYT